MKFITEHEGRKWVVDPTLPQVLPGRHEGKMVPLTPAEEMAELAKAISYFATQRALMKAECTTLYAALRKSFPIEQCWEELGVN